MTSIKSRSRKNILLAPHVDDELIGAYSLVRMGELTHIAYFEELDGVRKAEATAFCEAFGLIPIFNHVGGIGYLHSDDVLIAPTVNDSHPAHKRVNRIARSYQSSTGCRVIYYGVDMSTPEKVALTAEEQKDKRELFEKFYPSQAELLTDSKYFIFEEIFEDELYYGASARHDDIIICVEVFGIRISNERLQKLTVGCLTVNDVLSKIPHEWKNRLNHITVSTPDGDEYYG